MKIPLPKGKYIKKIDVNDDHLEVDFQPRKKVALLFISINERYWPYLKQVVEDCRQNFLPQHKVDYFVWSDMPEDQIQGATVIPTEPIEWPMPTLMRYHLFLNEEEKLKDYDYIFYLDADMRVVAKISDEIMGNGLTVAPHPGYVVESKLIPPLEPNPKSTAYIPRLGRIVDDHGQPRFIPFYAAGGFQGGRTKPFLKAMKVIKKNIDKDFENNYTAIWNDESHWNKYLWDFQRKGGDITFLDVSYIYPDSLIKEYYEPKVWGRSYPPKIVTLTKPFSLKHLTEEDRQRLGLPAVPHALTPFECRVCHDTFPPQPGHQIVAVGECPGSGKAHPLDLKRI